MNTGKKSEYSYLKYIMLFISLIFIVLYGLAIFSYDPFDSALNSASFPVQKSNNLIGEWGAQISGFLIFYIGWGVLLLPIAFFFTVNAYKTVSIRKTFSISFSLLLFYLGGNYFFFHFMDFITVNGVDISTLGKMGLWFLESFYDNVGNIGAAIIACTLIVLSLMTIFSFKCARCQISNS